MFQFKKFLHKHLYLFFQHMFFFKVTTDHHHYYFQISLERTTKFTQNKKNQKWKFWKRFEQHHVSRATDFNVTDCKNFVVETSVEKKFSFRSQNNKEKYISDLLYMYGRSYVRMYIF